MGRKGVGRFAACFLLCLSLISAYTCVFAEGGRSSSPVVLVPTASGETVYEGGGAVIDASNASEGYICVKYNGSSSKTIKLQVVPPQGKTNQYTLSKGQFQSFPLSSGDGTYTVGVYEQVQGNSYSTALVKKINVKLKSMLSPFLYPSQYIDFNANSQAVKKASELAAGAASDLEVVRNVYDYVINHVAYDSSKASSIVSGAISVYVPDVDETLSTGKGICFDYAALMASMLRSQNIPTRMEHGYVSTGAYHAWVDVYIQDVGWIENVYYFDGKNWTLMDPTFGSSGKGNANITQFIGDGTNYTPTNYY